MISMEPDDRKRRAAARQNARMPTLTRLLTSYDRAYHRDPSSPDLPLPPPAPTTTLVTTELRPLQAGPLPLIQVLLPHLRVRPGRYSRIRRERRSPMELWDEAIPSRRVHICVRSRQARERACLRGEDPYAPVLGLPVDAGAHYYQTVDRRLLPLRGVDGGSDVRSAITGYRLEPAVRSARDVGERNA